MKYLFTFCISILSLSVYAQSPSPSLNIRSGINDFYIENNSGFSQTYILLEDNEPKQHFTLNRHASKRIKLDITKNSIKRYNIVVIYDYEAFRRDSIHVRNEIRALSSGRKNLNEEFVLRLLDGYLLGGVISKIDRIAKSGDLLFNGGTPEEYFKNLVSWGIASSDLPPWIKPIIGASWAVNGEIFRIKNVDPNEIIALQNYWNACFYKYYYTDRYEENYNLSRFIDLYPRYSLSIGASNLVSTKMLNFKGQRYGNTTMSSIQFSNFSNNLPGLFMLELQNRWHVKNRVEKKSIRSGYMIYLNMVQTPVLYKENSDNVFEQGTGFAYRSFGVDLGRSYRFRGANRPIGINFDLMVGGGAVLESNVRYGGNSTPIRGNSSFSDFKFDFYSARIRYHVLFDFDILTVFYDYRLEFGLRRLEQDLPNYYFGLRTHSLGVSIPLYRNMKPAPDYNR